MDPTRLLQARIRSLTPDSQNTPAGTQLTAAHPHDLRLRATDDPEQSCALKREALRNGSHEVSPLSAGV